nr:annexin [Hymenolepis microstoma]
MSGYPHKPNPSPQGQMGGYKPQGQMGGYPPQGQMGGYPPQGQMGGYPPQGQMGGYPPQGQMGGYPPQGHMGPPGQFGLAPPGQMGYQPGGPMGFVPPGSMAFQPHGPMGYPHQGQSSTQMSFTNPYYMGRPTVLPFPNFNANDDSQALYKAMKGLGTNESAIIKVLSQRTFEQRKDIAQSFKSSFGKDLDKSLKSEISGKFESVVLLSLQGLPGLLASSMRTAIKGAGTDETLLLQCIIPFQNAIIRETAQVYDKTTGHKLEADIRNDTGGDFQKILIAMIQGTRDEGTNVDFNMVNADAQRLYKAGEGKIGTEEAVFTQIFAQRSFAHIKALSQAYEQQFKTPLIKAIKRETSSNYEDALVAIVKFAEDKNALLAEWLYTSMRGAGTDEDSLILLVLSRSEIDLADVKDAYQRKYNKTLAKAISGDTSGDFKKMLLGIVGD